MALVAMGGGYVGFSRAAVLAQCLALPQSD